MEQGTGSDLIGVAQITTDDEPEDQATNTQAAQPTTEPPQATSVPAEALQRLVEVVHAIPSYAEVQINPLPARPELVQLVHRDLAIVLAAAGEPLRGPDRALWAFAGSGPMVDEGMRASYLAYVPPQS